MSGVSHILGLDDPSGSWYAFWSGFGSDLGYFAVFGALVAHYRRRTCHVDSPRFCWRPGTHPIPGAPYRLCKKHHSGVPDQITLEVVNESLRGGGGAA